MKCVSGTVYQRSCLGFLPGCLLVFLFTGLPVFAQYPAYQQRPSSEIPLANTGQLGIMLGPTFYAGELNADGFSFGKSTSMGLALFGQYQISNVFGLRFQLLGGFLKGGTKTTIVNQNVLQESFSGIFLEATANSTINLLNLITPYASTPFSLYTILGVGYGGWYSKLDSKIYYADSLASDNPLQNFNAAPVLPVGLGFQYRIGKRVSVGLDYTARFYFSDKLDNTPGQYRNDIIHYLSFGLAWNLGTGNRAHTRRSGPLPILPDPYLRPSKTGDCKPVEDHPAAIPPASPSSYTAIPAPLVSPPQQPAAVVSYAVQIFAFAHHDYSADWIARKYRIPMSVRREQTGSVDRFLVGSCTDLSCARALKQQMIRLGIRDAFIVSYKNGVRGGIIRE